MVAISGEPVREGDGDPPTWNIATLGFFVYLVIGLFHESPVITTGVHFLLFVLINKLFNRVGSKDYRQVYVISFLVLVAATTLNPIFTRRRAVPGPQAAEDPEAPEVSGESGSASPDVVTGE